MTTTLTLDSRLNSNQRKALSRLPGLTIVDAPTSALIRTQSVEPVRIVNVSVSQLLGIRDDADAEPGVTLLLVQGLLDDGEALRLEDQGIGFVDAGGRAWIPGVSRTRKARRERGTLKPASLRAAQILADHPGEQWTEPRLMRRADTGASTAHALLKMLRELGLVERVGHGRQTKTHVSDPQGLRRWLVRQSDPDETIRLPCYVRDPAQLPEEVGGVFLVHSGARAAELVGLPVMTGDPKRVVRVAVGRDQLDDWPALLGGVRTERGANVLLVADVGALGIFDAARLQSGQWVAPMSRIAMDLLLEPRGSAAADVFLELWQDQSRV